VKSLVVYATRTGNTRLTAEAIAEGLRAGGTAEVRPATEDPAPLPDDLDVLVVGGPTEGHGMTEPIATFLDGMPDGAWAGRAAAAFDTRLQWPRWLSGSAADGIRQRLERAGALRPVPTESFAVTMKPELEPGELDRAQAWGTALAASLAPAGAGAMAQHSIGGTSR
jgi:flavodoxin